MMTSSESFGETDRREIAVIFCDLRGFTSFTETAEPEEVMAVLGDFHKAVGTLVRRFGATVGDFAGDGVMAYIDDPGTFPDPANAAVRMAIELRDLLAGVVEVWRRRGHTLSAGIGVAVGYATLGMVGFGTRREYKPVGTVVNLAARLCEKARPGQILISQRAYAATEAFVHADPVAEIALKGMQRPVQAYEVLSLLEVDRPVADGAKGSVFVGRHEQLRQLQAALQSAIAGSGGVVLLSGEPGIGKTRLAEELAGRATDDGALVVWGRCSGREGTPAFWPWMQVVGALCAERSSDELREALCTDAGVIAQIVPEVQELAPGEEPPPALDADAGRFRLYGAVTRFLSRIAVRTPLVVILDDLHWADVPSLQLLAYLVREIHGAPLGIVATYRDVDPVIGPPLSDVLADLARASLVSRVALSGLDVAEVAEFMAAAGRAPSDAVVATVHDRTEGNPFFVGELVRLLENAAGERAAEAALSSVVPEGVRDVIRYRLSRLPQTTFDQLTVAAVAGRNISVELLARSADLSIDTVLDRLEPAVGARMVVELPGRPGEYRFSHALINEVLYEEAGAIQRSRLHRRVGEALEELYGEDDGTHLAELASHFYRAVPAVDPAKALRFALRVSEWAQTRLAYEQAEEQLGRALELVRRLPVSERTERELEIQLRRTVLLTTTSGYGADAVGQALTRAHELCGQCDNRQRAALLWGLHAFHLVRAEFEQAQRYGEELRREGDETGDELFVMTGDWALGTVALNLGRLPEAIAHLERAAAFADALRDPTLADLFVQHPSANCRAFLALARSLSDSGDDGEAGRAVAIAAELHQDFSLANGMLFDAIVTLFRDDVEGARQRAHQTMAFCEQRGFGLFYGSAQVLYGWAACRLGNVEEGAAEMRAGRDRLEAIGGAMLDPFHQGLEADVLERTGRPREALEILDRALARPGGSFWDAELHRARARLLMTLHDDRSAAEQELRQAVAVARQQGARLLEVRAAEELDWLCQVVPQVTAVLAVP